MRLALDEMLDPEIAAQLRLRGWDVIAVANEPDLRGLGDVELLRALRPARRALVTDNVDDFARLHRDFLGANEDHAGLVFAAPARFPRRQTHHRDLGC